MRTTAGSCRSWGGSWWRSAVPSPSATLRSGSALGRFAPLPAHHVLPSPLCSASPRRAPLVLIQPTQLQQSRPFHSGDPSSASADEDARGGGGPARDEPLRQQRRGGEDASRGGGEERRSYSAKRGSRGGRRGEELRSWRRQLLLRVHPDLFQAPHHAEARAVNQRSLQAFQSLAALAGHAASSSSTTLPSLPVVDESLPLFTFHFYLRPTADDDAEVPPAPSHPALTTETTGEERLREVRYEFRPAPEVRRNAVRLRRAAEECMLQLFSLAGLIQPLKPSAPAELKTHDGWIMTDWSEDAFKQKAIEAIRFAPAELKLSYQEELAAMLEPDMIFFDKLTHSQKMHALECLTTNLERLGYAEWANIPLLIGKQYSRRAEGFVVIPYNFTVPRLVEYLNKHLPEIKSEREHIRADVHLIADLSHRLQERLGLQDVSVWGSKRAAIGCLQRLMDVAGHMASHDLADSTLVLTDSLSSSNQRPLQRPQRGDQEEGDEVSDKEQQLLRDDEEEKRKRDAFRYDASTRRLYVRKDFNKAALLEFLRTRPRPDDDVVEAPGAYQPIATTPRVSSPTPPTPSTS